MKSMGVWENLYENRNMEIMIDFESRQAVALGEIMHSWQGEHRYQTGKDA